MRFFPPMLIILIQCIAPTSFAAHQRGSQCHCLSAAGVQYQHRRCSHTEGTGPSCSPHYEGSWSPAGTSSAPINKEYYTYLLRTTLHNGHVYEYEQSLKNISLLKGKPWYRTRHVLATTRSHQPQGDDQEGDDLASFPGYPLALTKNKNGGRAWYRFARDITARRRHGNNWKTRDAIM